MPDHPHEGECVEPTDLSQTLDFGGVPACKFAQGSGTCGAGTLAPCQ